MANSNSIKLCECGCGKRTSISEKTGQPNRYINHHWRTHGHASSKGCSSTYQIWAAMLRRCNNPNTKDYDQYGGRGITVCQRWHKFENFLKDMGEKPCNHSIDRKENDANYEPNNCQWATPKMQANNRSNNRVLTFRNETKTVSQWADDVGLKYSTLLERIRHYGWSVEKALTTKARPRAPNR